MSNNTFVLEETTNDIMNVTDINPPILENESPPPNFVNMNTRNKEKREKDYETQESGELVFNLLIQLQSEQRSQFEKINSELKEIKQQNENIQAKQVELEAAVKFVSAKYDDLDVQVKTLESKFNMKLSNQKDETTAYIDELEENIENLQRTLRSRTIEIRNVPSNKGENLELLMKDIYKVLSLEFRESDIKDMYRLPSKDNTNKPLIVELENTKSKANLLSAMKTYNLAHKEEPISSTTLGFQGQTRPLYASEYLSMKAAKIFYLGRMLKKNKSYKYCWTASGKVYVKKDDNSPAVELKTIKQAELLTSPRD